MIGDPRGIGPLRRAGQARASLAAIMLHGRGAGAESIMALAGQLGATDVALFAPEAAGRSWWPTSFLAPMAELEPHLTSALGAVDRSFDAAEAEGYGPDRTILLGFSQGGCLALEYAARRGARARNVFGLSAGLVGTADVSGPRVDDLYGHAPKRFEYDTDLDGVSIYIGCHDQDPHIPSRRVKESEGVFANLGANCTVNLADGHGHGLTAPDVERLRQIFLRTSD